MQSKQYELCLAVLKRLSDAGVLQHLVLVGSWCLPLYRAYFHDSGGIYPLKTRDMDFLVPASNAFQNMVSIPELLKDLGFITGFRGHEGYMYLQHPELMIEFLVPERGRGSSGAKKLPKLGMNAQPLRFMDVALAKTMQAALGDITLTIPHPAAFALQKILVAPRRGSKEKRKKDFESAFVVLDLLLKEGQWQTVVELFTRLPSKWKKTIVSAMKAEGHGDLASKLV